MTDEIKEILERLNKIIPYASVSKELAYMTTNITPQECKTLLDYIITLQEENERLNNIINTILDFNLFKDECPLCLGYLGKCDEEKAQDVFYEEEYCENCSDDYKKCWLKYFERLQELKENKQ